MNIKCSQKIVVNVCDVLFEIVVPVCACDEVCLCKGMSCLKSCNMEKHSQGYVVV